MPGLFYGAGVIAVVATALALTRANAVHALLYLVVSLLAVALAFFGLGAPFAAALEVIVYAGAVMVLFVFVVMLVSPGRLAGEPDRRRLVRHDWNGPALLTALLFAELAWSLEGERAAAQTVVVGPREVGLALFGPYLLGVELVSLLLLAGLVAAYHLGRRPQRGEDLI